jgi:hypothetical protein
MMNSVDVPDGMEVEELCKVMTPDYIIDRGLRNTPSAKVMRMQFSIKMRMLMQLLLWKLSITV